MSSTPWAIIGASRFRFVAKYRAARTAPSMMFSITPVGPCLKWAKPNSSVTKIAAATQAFFRFAKNSGEPMRVIAAINRFFAERGQPPSENDSQNEQSRVPDKSLQRVEIARRFSSGGS